MSISNNSHLFSTYAVARHLAEYLASPSAPLTVGIIIIIIIHILQMRKMRHGNVHIYRGLYSFYVVKTGIWTQDFLILDFLVSLK